MARNLAIYLMLAIALFALFGGLWIVRTYGKVDFAAVIFHFNLPHGANAELIIGFILQVLCPSVVLPVFAFFKKTQFVLFALFFLALLLVSVGFVACVRAVYEVYVGIAFVAYKADYAEYFAVAIAGILGILAFYLLVKYAHRAFGAMKWTRISLVCGIFAIALVSLQKEFDIKRFVLRDYSSFYEENYVRFAPDSVADSTALRNLIVIIVESLESTYSSRNIPQDSAFNARDSVIGGGHSHNASHGIAQIARVDSGDSVDSSAYSPFGELMPNLTRIASENINFSPNSALGGIFQSTNTSWTIAGTSAYMCAVPLNVKIGFRFEARNFLNSAICIGDVLAHLGYTQMAILGYDSRFGGSIGFFRSHQIHAHDYFDLHKDYGIDDAQMPRYKGFWGFKDAVVFQRAREFIRNYTDSAPFALYLPTSDTHFPNGFVDKEYCGNLGESYEDSIKCTDKIISDFVEFVRNSPFGANTSIVIIGDHLSMKQGFFPPHAKRYIYNAFINPQFSAIPRTDLVKNRALSHFDIGALILDSIGVKTESFGLGRNPLYGKTLLEIYGTEAFNRLITQDSRAYEDLWK